MADAEITNLPPAYDTDPGGGTAISEPVTWHRFDQEHKVSGQCAIMLSIYNIVGSGLCQYITV